MPDDFLGSVEFSGESGNHTPEEFIDLTHDPDILYYYILDAKEKLNSGIEIDADGKEDEVLVHAKVEIFQSVMQYMEAFSIYYLAYIKGREDLIEYLISTQPKEVKTFYEKLRRDREEEYLDEYDIDSDYRELMETLFGYRFMSEEADEEDLEQIDLEESSFDSIEELIEFSAETLDDRIRTIGEFYLDFGNAYNAVKHGNRAIPQTDGEFHISSDDGEVVELGVDMEFVQFLCRHEGDAYITAIPIDHLLKHSLNIAETVHDLFTYLRKVAQAAIDDEREFSVPLFEPTESSSEPGRQWTKVWNQHSVIILPVTDEIAELMAESEVSRTLACCLHAEGNKMVIETENDEDITDDYPILATISQQGIVGLTPRPRVNLEVNLNLTDLDIQHYLDLLELKDATAGGAITQTKLRDEAVGEEFALGELEMMMNLSLIADPYNRDLIEQLAILQTITETRIPAPMELIPPQIEVIEDWIESDREAEDAEQAVEELQEIGDDLDFTFVFIDLITPDQEGVQEQFVGMIPGRIDFDFEFETEGGQERYEELIEPSQQFSFPAYGYSGTHEELVSYLEGDTERIHEVLASLGVGTGGVPDLRVQYTIGESGFWRTEHTLRLQVIDTSQSHGPIECQLCGEVTTDIQTHLTEECDAELLS